jgi:hypothetical protein
VIFKRSPHLQMVVLSGEIADPMTVRDTDPISSKTARPDDEFHGTVAANVFQSNLVLIPSGTPVLGQVVEAKEAGHFVGQASLTIELVSIRLPSPDGPQNVSLITESLSSKANGRGANTAEKTAGGAGVGALIGALAGGRHGGRDRRAGWRRPRGRRQRDYSWPGNQHQA